MRRWIQILDFNNWKKNRQAGFTLLEVLIAITLLSFVILSIVAITDGSIQTKERVISEDNQYLQVQTALDRIDWDISQAYSPLYFSHEMKPQNLTDAEGDAYNQLVATYQNNDRFAFPSYDALPVPVFKFEDKTTLTFFTSSNRRKLKNIKQSNFAWARYTLGSDDSSTSGNPNKSNGVLIRKFTADDIYNPEAIDWSNIKGQILLRNVESVKWEFWDPSTKKWVENLASVQNGNYLFRAVRLTLIWIDPDELETTFIQVFRPLFPYFEPEDMYKLETKSDPVSGATTSTNGSSGGSTTTGSSGSSGSSGGSTTSSGGSN